LIGVSGTLNYLKSEKNLSADGRFVQEGPETFVAPDVTVVHRRIHLTTRRLGFSDGIHKKSLPDTDPPGSGPSDIKGSGILHLAKL
jgi:hypothetical protein